MPLREDAGTRTTTSTSGSKPRSPSWIWEHTPRPEGRETLSYDALILALGAEPQRPPIPGFDSPKSSPRSLKDAQTILAAAKTARRVAIVGASFIGWSGASLKHQGWTSTSWPGRDPVGPRPRRCGRPWIARCTRRRASFPPRPQVQGFQDGKLGLDNGKAIEADFIVAGHGCETAHALAEAAGMKVDTAVVVDRWLRTSVDNVYGVGTSPAFPDAHAGKRSVSSTGSMPSARPARRAPAARRRCPFTDTPFFWSVHQARPSTMSAMRTVRPTKIQGSLERRTRSSVSPRWSTTWPCDRRRRPRSLKRGGLSKARQASLSLLVARLQLVAVRIDHRSGVVVERNGCLNRRAFVFPPPGCRAWKRRPPRGCGVQARWKPAPAPRPRPGE